MFNAKTENRTINLSIFPLFFNVINHQLNGCGHNTSRSTPHLRLNSLRFLRRRSYFSLNRCLYFLTSHNFFLSLPWHTVRNYNDAPHLGILLDIFFMLHKTFSRVSFHPHGLLLRSLRESNPRERFCRASAKPLTQETKSRISSQTCGYEKTK